MLDHIRFAIVILCISWLTLMVFASEKAKQYWWEYAILLLILESSNILGGRLRERGRRIPRGGSPKRR
jgi:hypothetical protein